MLSSLQQFALALILSVAIFFTGYATSHFGWLQGNDAGSRLTVVDSSISVVGFAEALSPDAWAGPPSPSLLESRRPVRVDTVIEVREPVPPPDTVIFRVRANESGRLTIPMATRIEDAPVDSMYDAQILRGVDISDCDEGFSVGPEGVICDKATLGHLYFTASAGAALDPLDRTVAPALRGRVGLEWEPSYRSPSAFFLRGDLSGRVEIGYQHRLEIF